MDNQRIILHIDMNAYFASVEQKANPSLRGKPIIVCGEGRTVVTTASYEAREYGVKTAMTLPEALKLCPEAIIVYGNPIKYIDTSLKIHKILVDYSDRVEIFSIDEYFLDLTNGKDPDFEKAIIIAKGIKQRIKENFGLSCSIGIAENKLLAKLAGEMRKPDGLTLIKPEDKEKILENLPVEELCGIGEKIKEHLHALGIKTCGELGRAPVGLLVANFGFWGYHLKRMGKGEDANPVKYYWEEETVKSIGHSHTLPKDTEDLEIIKAYLLMLCEKVGVRLRQANLMGRTVMLILRYSDFSTFAYHLSLKHYIKTGKGIYFAAIKILEEKVSRLKRPIRLIGVTISNLIPEQKQTYLFETLEKEEKLTQATDRINEKYGEFTIKPALLLTAEKFGILSTCGLIGRYLFKDNFSSKRGL